MSTYDVTDPNVQRLLGATDAQLRKQGVSDSDITALRKAAADAPPHGWTKERYDAHLKTIQAANADPVAESVAAVFPKAAKAASTPKAEK